MTHAAPRRTVLAGIPPRSTAIARVARVACPALKAAAAAARSILARTVPVAGGPIGSGVFHALVRVLVAGTGVAFVGETRTIPRLTATAPGGARVRSGAIEVIIARGPIAFIADLTGPRAAVRILALI
jgi:hypothetical protein